MGSRGKVNLVNAMAKIMMLVLIHRESVPWNALHASCSTKSNGEPHNCDFSVFDQTFDTSFKPYMCQLLKHVQITLQYDSMLCTF